MADIYADVIRTFTDNPFSDLKEKMFGFMPTSERIAVKKVGGLVTQFPSSSELSSTATGSGAALIGFESVSGLSETTVQDALAALNNKIDTALSNLTNNRLIQSNGSGQLTSVASLSSWIAGTANEIDVSDDGDGTVTLSISSGFNLDHNSLISLQGGSSGQRYHLNASQHTNLTSSSPTFSGLTLSGLTSGRIPFVGAGGIIQDDGALTWDSTADQMTITRGLATGSSRVRLQNNIGNFYQMINFGSTEVGTLLGQSRADAAALVTSGEHLLIGTTNSKNLILGTNDASALIIDGTQGVSLSSLTPGRIPFAGTGGLIQDDGALNWDNTNKRLGIGTATPSMLLQIVTPAATNDVANIVNITDGSFADFNINLNRVTTLLNSTTVIRMTNSIFGIETASTRAATFNGHRFGISTASPQSILHIQRANGVANPDPENSDVAIRLIDTSNTFGGNPALLFGGFTNKVAAGISLYFTNGGNNTQGSLDFWVRPSDTGSLVRAGRFSTNGYFGVGLNTLASYPLDIANATPAQTIARLGTNLPVYVVQASPHIGFNAYYSGSGWFRGAGSSNSYCGAIGYEPSSGIMRILTSSNSGNNDTNVTLEEAMRIDSGQRVGIGTTDTSLYRLSVMEQESHGIQIVDELSPATNYLSLGINHVEAHNENLIIGVLGSPTSRKISFEHLGNEQAYIGAGGLKTDIGTVVSSIVKHADQTNNGTTLANDTHLVFTAKDGRHYHVEYTLITDIFYGASGNDTDFKFRTVMPAWTPSKGIAYSLQDNEGISEFNMDNNGSGTLFVNGQIITLPHGNNSKAVIKIHMYFQTTGDGLVQLQWAKGSNGDGTDLTVHAGSKMDVTYYS